jgi:hypothetical protein
VIAAMLSATGTNVTPRRLASMMPMAADEAGRVGPDPEQFKVWLEKENQEVLPKSTKSHAMEYMLNNWVPLVQCPTPLPLLARMAFAGRSRARSPGKKPSGKGVLARVCCKEPPGSHLVQHAE